MKNKLSPFLISLLVVGLVFMLTSTVKKLDQLTSTTLPLASEPQPEHLKNCAVSLPSELDFAGESVPISDDDVRERLDRELHVNTYFHSSSFQNFKLANRYFPVIEPILKANGIPDDFKYLAVAESGLRNKTSPAGAKGYWQFMKETGKKYGLEITDEVDERMDIEKATVAACKYLKDGYGSFNSWTLSAASYNMGNGGISNQLKNQQVDSYYDLYLNEETSRYVFRILALKLIMSKPSDYGFCYEQDDLYMPLRFKTIKVSESILDLASFAKANNTNLKEVKNLNPWLIRNSLTIKPGSYYHIKLPA